MPSLKEIRKSALTTGLEDVVKDENMKTAVKKCLKENSIAFLDDTVSRMSPRKSIKGNTNKQIAISSSKPKKRNLDLFLLPPTQLSFQKGKSIDYHPITSLSDGGPIEFKVSGSGKEFLDLARSYLYLRVKISKADGSNLDGASKVSFANYCKFVQSSGRHFGW